MNCSVLTGLGARVALASLLSVTAGFSQTVLETFASARNSVGGGPLWNVYNGDPDCTNQTWAIANIQGNDNIPAGPGAYCPYAHFFPDGQTYGYNFPYGYAQYYLLGGNWTATYNRMSLEMNCTASFNQPSDGIGSYVRDHSSTDPAFQGQHYYHGYSTPVTANQWVKWTINDHPNHRVGEASGINWPHDPEWVLPTQTNPVHYFDGLTRFYLNPTRINLPTAYTCSYKNVVFTTVTGEPDEYVSTLAVTYNGTSYNLDWNGPKSDVTSYDIRYSTSGSLKLSGFSSGTAGSSVSSSGDTYNTVHWISPAMPQANAIWFGIRPHPSIIGSTGSGVAPIRLSTDLDVMLSPGDQIQVSGVGGNTAANGLWAVTPVPRQFWQISNRTLANIVVPSGTAPVSATVNTVPPHNLKPGQMVMVYLRADSGEWGYGLIRPVLSTPTATSFTFSTSEPAGTYTTGGLQVWSLPALDLNNSTGNGAYTSGGSLVATNDKKNFTEIALPANVGMASASACDVNADALVDSIDVQMVTNQALGISPCVNDLTQDGTCNVLDVQRVISAAQTGACQVGP